MPDKKITGLFGEVELKTKHKCKSLKKRYEDYGEDWDEISNTCLILANHKCKDCGKTANHAHHIIPLRKGGTNEQLNLKAVCHSCHAKYHPHLRSKKYKASKKEKKSLF
jgi:5-methylcytosine-specific restriction endonuclease McrA